MTPHFSPPITCLNTKPCAKLSFPSAFKALPLLSVPILLTSQSPFSITPPFSSRRSTDTSGSSTAPPSAVSEMSPDDGGYYPAPPPFPFNFHLLEVTLISAQDLFPSSRSIRTYAVAWVHSDHRLRTRLDAVGHTDPTWNDKFVFRVDDATLRSDTSAVHVNIYAARPRFMPGPDNLLGTARAILSTLRPSSATRFVALQIRRPVSLRPQGILNIGVALIDAYVRSLPLYTDLGASAFAYHDLMGATKQEKKEKAASKEDNATIPVEAGDRQAEMERSGSMAGWGEKERVLLEKKLKKWRSEIPAVEDHRGWENLDDEESSRRGKTRRPRAMSCFSLAGQYGDENSENEGHCDGDVN